MTAAAPTEPRLPPGQGLLRRKEAWPVIGETAPRAGDDRPWRVTIGGLSEREAQFDLAALAALPQEDRLVDFHCVTRWSKFDMRFRGPRLMALVEAAGPDPRARHLRLVARSDRDHDTGLSLADARRLDPIVALDYDGAPLPIAHGGPARVITTGKYGYKSLKWLETIELRDTPALGYWERGPGYHDNADPWSEERYVTGNISPERRAQIIETRRVVGRSLLSVDFSDCALRGFEAAGAELRNCRFDRADLSEASFAGANCSNASFCKSTLSGASFRDADVEGADFSGADLRGVDFSGASLFGASFIDGRGVAARLDGVALTRQQIASLVDDQARFVRTAAVTGDAP